MHLLRRFLASTGGRTVIIAALLVSLYQGWLTIQAPGKIDPAVWDGIDRRGRVSIEVEFGFAPERFHILHLQEIGRIRRTRGSVVEVRSVEVRSVGELARNYWVKEIRPAEP